MDFTRWQERSYEAMLRESTPQTFLNDAAQWSTSERRLQEGLWDFFSNDQSKVLEAWQLLQELPTKAVTSAQTINARTHKPERGGLYCSQIFGPTIDHCCFCGKYQGQQNHDILCNRCGVSCVDSERRSRFWAHAQLPQSIIHPCYRSKLAKALDLSEAKLLQIELCQSYLQNGRVQSIKSTPTGIPDEIQFNTNTGSLAIKHQLEQRHPNHELSNFGVFQAIPIPPPRQRPLSITKNKEPKALKNNKIYSTLIRQSSLLTKFSSPSTPRLIQFHTARAFQQSVDALFRYQLKWNVLAHMSANDS